MVGVGQIPQFCPGRIRFSPIVDEPNSMAYCDGITQSFRFTHVRAHRFRHKLSPETVK